MKNLSVGELKTHFSAALDEVMAGQTIIVSYGRNHQKVAALVPISALNATPQRTLGVLAGKASVHFADDFALSDEALLTA
jgi:antitoxin (DNA-binding transcriptional repressor) of toxin-antitoxin stability system